MKFGKLEEFKQSVRDYTIQLGRDIKWVKNDKIRFMAKCKEETFYWGVYCAYHNARNYYQIKTFYLDHSCGRVFKNKQANYTWATRKLVRKMTKEVKIKHLEIIDYLKHKFGVAVKDTKFWRVIECRYWSK